MEFQLSAKEMESNYKKFLSLIPEYFPTRKEAILNMYKDLGEERMIFLPASSTSHFHNAIPGGYIDHVLRVMDFSISKYENTVDLGIDVSNFTIEELLFAAMHHDLGKVGFPGEGKDGYIFNKSEWHRKNQGKMYEPNPEIPFTLVQDRSLFLLQYYGIQCSWNEYLAIKTHDGLYDDSNKPYLVSYSLQAKMRTYMPQILHEADYAAAKFEFMRWNKASKQLNTQRLEDSKIQFVNNNPETQKQTSKKATAAAKLELDFDDIFK